jgi:hypothetical protein
LLEVCASLVIEKRHCYIIISFADKIELAFKSDPIIARRKGAVRGFHNTVLNLPVRDKLCNGALPSLGLVINVSEQVRLERNGIDDRAERANDEECAEVD